MLFFKRSYQKNVCARKAEFWPGPFISMYSSLEGRAKHCQWQCKQQIKFLLSKPSYLYLGRTVCMQRDYLTSAMQSLPSKRVSSQHPNRYFASPCQYERLGLWLMQNKTSCLSFPSCYTGTINKVTSISLHSMKSFLPHLLEDCRERKKIQKETKWKRNEKAEMMYRCCRWW